MSSAVSLLKGESKTMHRKEKRARIEQIRVILGLSDSQRTPVVMLYLVLFILSLLDLLLSFSLAGSCPSYHHMFVLEEIMANHSLPAVNKTYLYFLWFILKAWRITERFLQEDKYVLANGCL